MEVSSTRGKVILNFFLGSILPFLFAISVIKFLGNSKTYFQGIAVVMGAVSLYFFRKDLVKIEVLLLAWVMGVLSIFIGEAAVGSFLRLLQLITMTGLILFCLNIWDDRFEIRVFWIWILGSFLFFGGGLLGDQSHLQNSLVFSGLKRYPLLLGEPNYSALLYLVAAILCVRSKKWFFFTAFVFFLLMTGSRASIITLLFFLCFYLLIRKWPRLLKACGFTLLVTTITYPILLILMDLCTPERFTQWLGKITSARYFIHLTYVKMAIVYPFGLGLEGASHVFNEVFVRDVLPFINYQTSDFMVRPQQHSFFLQILTGLGVVPYLLVMFYFIHLFFTTFKDKAFELSAILALALNASSLNCTNELALFLLLGIILKNVVGPRGLFSSGWSADSDQ